MKTKTILITLTTMLVVTVLIFQSCNKEEETENQAPTCEITAPTNNQVFVKGETITISVESIDNNGNDTEVRFDINGVGKGSASSYPFKYNWSTADENIGQHIIKATSIDNVGNSSTDKIAIELTYNPPTALFTVSPSSGTINTNFAFDASGSSDIEDPISDLQVRWDFDGNGSWDIGWDTNKTQNHQYGSDATYTAKLEVKDTDGLTDQYTKNITVVHSCEGQSSLTYGGQTYELVAIGNQCWMAENLNYETSNSWWYNNSSANGNVYGRLYTWEAALTACPSGWSLPSDDEWKTMEMALGMSQSEADDRGWRGINEGEKMKSTSGWNNYGNGTNSSGFNALPGGLRPSNVSFYGLGRLGYWWSSTEHSGTDAWCRDLIYNSGQVGRGNQYKTDGYSVRCLKN